jgi:hypothetical protein
MDNPIVYAAFFSGSAWYSKIIEGVTHGPSHFAFVYNDPLWRGWLQVGSDPGGFMPTALDRQDLRSLYTLPVDLWPTLQTNIRQLGAAYDFGGLLGMGWVELWYAVARKWATNPLMSKHAWWCSEIGAAFIKQAGLPLPIAPGSTSPKLLEQEIAKLKAVRHEPKDVIV